ncbi:MAG: hypothetical protein Q9195_006979 [Heterodermia aff. obscurata]
MVDNRPEVLRAGGNITLMIRIPYGSKGRMVVLDKELQDIIYNSIKIYKIAPRQVVASLNNILRPRSHGRYIELVEGDLNLDQICEKIEKEVRGSQLGSSDPRRHIQEPASGHPQRRSTYVPPPAQPAYGPPLAQSAHGHPQRRPTYVPPPAQLPYGLPPVQPAYGHHPAQRQSAYDLPPIQSAYEYFQAQPTDAPPHRPEPVFAQGPREATSAQRRPKRSTPRNRSQTPPAPRGVDYKLDAYYGLAIYIRQRGTAVSVNTNEQRYIYQFAAHESYDVISDGLLGLQSQAGQRIPYASVILPATVRDLFHIIRKRIPDHPREQNTHWAKVNTPYRPGDQPTARAERLPPPAPEPEPRPAPSAAATEDRPVSPSAKLFLPRSSRPRDSQGGSHSQAEPAPALAQQLAQTQISSSSLAPLVLTGSKRQKSYSPSTGDSSKSSASPITKPMSSRDDRSRDDRSRHDRYRDDRYRDDRSRDDRPRHDRQKTQRKKRRDDRDRD